MVMAAALAGEVVAIVKEPLNKFMDAQHGLKRTAARRVPQAMAVVLVKGRNNADVRFRPCPQGPTENSVLCVATFRQTPVCLQSHALITKFSVGLSVHKLIQRLLKFYTKALLGGAMLITPRSMSFYCSFIA